MTLLETQAAYALWAPHYTAAAHNPLMHVEERALVSMLPSLQGVAALDAACGTGRYMRILEELGARTVIGVDRSASMLAHAHGPVAIGDLCALPVRTASIDLIVSGLAVNDVADLAGVMRELARALRPGGTLVYSSLHPRGAESRWTRTFEADGQTWSLPAFWHSTGDHEHACAAAGMAIDARREPEIAGRGPVALVIRASRS
jgi:malonyl-CoA O-methyltransferase